MQINGEVVIDEQATSFSGADVHVRLENTGRMDAGAEILFRKSLRGISHTRGSKTVVEFEFTSPESIHDHPRYNLRAHVDLSGNGEVEKGDMVSTQSTVVSPSENKKYSLKVRKV